MPPQEQALNLPCASTNTHQNTLDVSTGTCQGTLGRVQQNHGFAALGN